MNKMGGLRGALVWLALVPSCHLLVPSSLVAGSEPVTSLPPPRQLAASDEQPDGGLSLDEAIEMLLQRSYDLRIKFQELPKGRANVLSAGLRNNPSVFFSADNIPYGRYSPQRPGETDFELTLIQPVDINNKRRRRIRLAERAQRVTEALYQDAVRQAIDRLYANYSDVLEAALKVRAAQTDAALQRERVKAIRDLVPKLQPRAELTQALVNQGKAETALRKEEANLIETRRDLAALLAIPPEDADNLTPSGPLRDTAPLPPCEDDLIRIALMNRPDLMAYRLNVSRAEAQVERTRAERIEDAIVFYTPYQIQEFPGQSSQAALGWEAGSLIVLPVFDRKQGDIARANVEVRQTQTEVQGVELQIINEVRQAATDYAVSRKSVERYERDILPESRSVLAEKQRLFSSGREGIDVWLAARKDYNDVVRQYGEVLLRHRRAMLKLNTAVGQRLLP
ncbi:MAG TPA: TolC family protein [Gemmataceae bacterium]|nr:TolC family protein [Gemmataceae bacterium]